VSDICAGGGGSAAAAFSSVVTSYGFCARQHAPAAVDCGHRTALLSSFAGSVSIGFMHATPGDMKSLRSSAERIALMVADGGGGVASDSWMRPARFSLCAQKSSIWQARSERTVRILEENPCAQEQSLELDM
jgi:hypothetical protein